MNQQKINTEDDFKLLKILMAEDDEINQALAKNLFKKNGWNCDIVENGLLAIEKMQQSVYDLILMDVEMPHLNGYMTTLKIRNEFPSPKSEVPIIAITAHDSNAELKKCIDVGMNGYIFKPIQFKDLTNKIKSIFNNEGDDSLQETGTPSTPIAPPTQKKICNLTGLLTSCGNNLLIAKNIVKLFIAQTPSNMSNLEGFLTAGDWIGFRGLCHKMKSVYSLIGVSEVKMYLEEMEHDCEMNTVNVGKFQSYLVVIKGLNLGIHHELEEFIGGSNP